MKDEFIGFYEPTNKEVDKSWKEGIFIFDANALLNLYRYSDSTRKDFLLALDKLKDRIFMPHQVGHEFHSNRHVVIDSLANSYTTLLSVMKEIFDKNFQNQINQFTRHPSINVESLNKLKEKFFEMLSEELEIQKKTHPNFLDTDVILDKLTQLYKGKVGSKYSKDEFKKIYLEGKDRYEQLIPPGYKDQESKKKKGEQHVYGDLIIWKEIIDYTIKEKKLIVLVTDDRKEDWWTIENGKTIRPREELISEFFNLTGTRILIYSADSFLNFAKERKIVSTIKDESITEISEVRKADENLNSWLESHQNRLVMMESLSNSVKNYFSNNLLKTSPNTLSLYKDAILRLAKGNDLNEADFLQNRFVSSIADLDSIDEFKVRGEESDISTSISNLLIDRNNILSSNNNDSRPVLDSGESVKLKFEVPNVNKLDTGSIETRSNTRKKSPAKKKKR